MTKRAKDVVGATILIVFGLCVIIALAVMAVA